MKKINFVNNSEPYLSAENLNQMQSNIEEAINGVVESGSNGTSNWVKYADGTMQCYGYVDISGIETTAWGALYSAIIDNPFNFPQTFSEVPQCMINTPDISGRYTFNVHSVATSTTGVTKIGLNRATSITGMVRLNYIAIGKWK